jgi:adenylosuccinate lyase
MPLKVNGQEVKVVPISPLAQAQNMDEVNDVLQFMQVVGGMGPEAQLALKKDAVIDFIANRLGVPTSLLTSPEERQMMMQQMQQLAQQAQAMQQGQAPEQGMPPQGAM